MSSSIATVLTKQKTSCLLSYPSHLKEYVILQALFNLKPSYSIYWIVSSAGRMNQLKHNLEVYQEYFKHREKNLFSPWGISTINTQNLDSLLQFLNADKQTVWIMEKNAFEQQVPFPSELKKQLIMFKINTQYSLSNLQTTLQTWNYQREYETLIQGTYAIRGGIIDIFPFKKEKPIRLEFVGNCLVSIRHFDPQTQLSLMETINSYTVSSTYAALDTRKTNLFDYCKTNALYIIDDDHIITNSLQKLLSFPALIFSTKPSPQTFEEYTPIPSFHGKINEFMKDLQQKISHGFTPTIISNQIPRLRELSKQHEINQNAVVYIEKTLLCPGWVQKKEKKILYTDYEIFGVINSSSSPQMPLPVASSPTLFLTLTPGCYITHIDHGIGKFIGITQQQVGAIIREYLLIEFEHGDKIYVPTSKIDRVTKYLPPGNTNPKLSSLRNSKWQQTRKKIKQAIDNYSQELITLYTQRASTPGYTFPPADYIQKEIALSFPFMETADQLKAISEVTRDMESTHPMDRLICGDVGFGKTEIALRAAVKAVSGNKQVALLAPTTILVQQHYHTFSQRLASYPFVVESISRFKKPKAKQTILQKLKNGGIDIIIGTHQLLQPEVEFKNLGLLIIDEEQRFGVRAKEQLKHKRTQVDILTLTATPIPRTLYFSLTGIRDISVLNTPPVGRLPIKTIVTHHNNKLIRTIILQEIQRGGQVFIIYNRVQSIRQFAQSLATVVPETTFGIAHGQMKPVELEEQLYAFYTGKISCLVATNIIENGIDIPNANTLIVIDANHFGLADLYQMRGRVGRSNLQAYAYFLYKLEKLPKKQLQRLQALEELSEFGSGYELALRDLDIRGFGDILGTDQSGFINEIGLELYSRLIRQESKRLDQLITQSGEEKASKLDTFATYSRPEIDLPLTAYIPSSYIVDTKQRLHFYQAISLVEHPHDLEKIYQEIRDRFGKIPEEVENIFWLEYIRFWAKEKSIMGIKQQMHTITIFPLKVTPSLKNSCQKAWQKTLIQDGAIELKNILQKSTWKDILFSIQEDE